MASFKAAAAITLSKAIEGGYVKIAADSGGETYRGIARNKHPGWPGWAYIDAVKAKLGDGVTYPEVRRAIDAQPVFDALNERVEEFYRVEFWNKVRGDEITSQDVASLLFDGAVNSGPGTAVEWLQRALNVLNRCDTDVARWPDLVVDGGFGNKTLGVLRTALVDDAEPLLLWLVFVRGAFLVNLMERKESQEAFARGWSKRLAGFIRRMYAGGTQ